MFPISHYITAKGLFIVKLYPFDNVFCLSMQLVFKLRFEKTPTLARENKWSLRSLSCLFFVQT